MRIGPQSNINNLTLQQNLSCDEAIIAHQPNHSIFIKVTRQGHWAVANCHIVQQLFL